MKAKSLWLGLFGALAMSGLTAAAAEDFACPPPNQVNCVPAVRHIGPWKDNNGQTTGNAFTPNNQCANVITLGPGRQRLLCCYQKCGVFLRDVKAASCTKVDEANFKCD